MITLKEVRERYPEYNHLSDSDLSEKLYSKFGSNMGRNDFNKQIGYSGQSSILDYIPQPGMPITMNVASGLMSTFMGNSPQEKDIVRNIPQILSQTKPTTSQRMAQGFGESIPYMMTGVGSVPGLTGSLARIGTASGFGAAENPENRSGGALAGGLAGLGGEIIPGSLKMIGEVAEKIRPIRFVKNKISEMKGIYQDAVKSQESYYKKAIDPYRNEKITDNPERFLGFDDKNLSYKAKTIYDKFLKNKELGTLQDLQSQLYKDFSSPTRYKASVEGESIAIRDKAEIMRKNIVDKIKNYLGKDKNALASYEKGINITRDVVKPFESTKAMRDLVKGKVEEMMPNKFAQTLRTALNKENVEFPKDHFMRQALSDIEERLPTGKLFKAGIPKFVRQHLSPNFAELAQNPNLIKFLQNANLGYDPLNKSMIGLATEP